MSEPYIIREPETEPVPFVLSVPHCGTEFPEEIREDYVGSLAAQPDDTDWFVHDLYSFAPAMGITMIHARYSRWVIDLNRDPESRPLYDDGRIITGLTPSTNFLGREIYRSDAVVPDKPEVDRRLQQYYYPYHRKIEALLQERLEKFGKVILWDAHSIRRIVPTIRREKFPDMILGDNDGTTAAPSLIDTALQNLRSGPYGLNHNTPFKGGYITRSFGKPEENVHGLQLEMSKDLYMDDTETSYHEERAGNIREVLKRTFEQLLNAIEEL